MIDTLFVNGCSWTLGYLLEEQSEVMNHARSIGYEISETKVTSKHGINVPFPPLEVYNNFNWAGNVAKELNIPNIINHSEGGGSNARIVRTTVEYVRSLTAEQKSKTFIVIGWSLPDRNELYFDDKHGKSTWFFFNASQPFETLTPAQLFEPAFMERISRFWENYVVDVHNTYACIYNFFQQSELLANFLENQGIKYYFFNSFPVFWEWKDIPQNKIQELYNLANSYNSKYPVLPTTDTFAEFVGLNETLRLSDGHPNSLAYKLWAQHIVEDMKTKGIV